MLFDLLFPPRCVGCGKVGRYFCDACWRKIALHKIQWCPVCRYPALMGQAHPWCRKEAVLKGAVALFPYAGLVQKTIKKLKYRLVTDLAAELADKTVDKMKREEPALYMYLLQDFTLVPVPLHFWKENIRGFNQAEVLGRALAARFGWRVEADLLRRKKLTRMQSKLKREARLKNVSAAFSLDHPDSLNRLKNLNCLIFDDVWTTGATIKACARVLKKTGARKIYSLTLAR